MGHGMVKMMCGGPYSSLQDYFVKTSPDLQDVLKHIDFKRDRFPLRSGIRLKQGEMERVLTLQDVTLDLYINGSCKHSVKFQSYVGKTFKDLFLVSTGSGAYR